MNRRIVPILLLIAAVGCDTGPRAPALRDEPVYRNSRDGFRIQTPVGWTQTAKSDPQSGPLDREELLVRFEQQFGEAPAFLELTAIDLPETEALSTRLGQPSHSVKSWTAVGEPTSVKLGDQTASRYRYKDAKQIKEVTAVRRGGRVFLFTVLHSATDTKSRDQARTSIESLIWD